MYDEHIRLSNSVRERAEQLQSEIVRLTPPKEDAACQTLQTGAPRKATGKRGNNRRQDDYS